MDSNINFDEINIDALLALINGLEYNKDTDKYIFKGVTYKLENIIPLNTILAEYKFVSDTDLVDVVTVTCSRKYSIPVFDGFNKVKIDRRATKAQYERAYYFEKTKLKRAKEREEKEPRLRIKKVKEIKPKKEYAPIKCAYCGKEFTPKNRTHIYCSRLCQHRFNSKKQCKANEESRKTDKVCPICGKVFRANNWRIYCSKECYKVSQKIKRSKRYLRDKYNVENEKLTPLMDDSFLNIVEGQSISVKLTRYERNYKNRAEAIRIHGITCLSCGFNFNEFYGKELARNFIEIHHIKPVSQGEQIVNPKTDLVPLCANCHAMIHREKNPPMTIKEIKNRYKRK